MPPAPRHDGSGYRTRRTRIDLQPHARRRELVPCEGVTVPALSTNHAVTEYPRGDGTGDYALLVVGQPPGIVEAKKLTLGPQGVLTQAERYARGLTDSPLAFGGCRTPFASGAELLVGDAKPLR
jgi:type I restriction enzyme R subunit